MESSLTQLADDYYGTLEEDTPPQPIRHNCAFYEDSYHNYPPGSSCRGDHDQMGYDMATGDWRCNYDDYEDDEWYDDDYDDKYLKENHELDEEDKYGYQGYGNRCYDDAEFGTRPPWVTPMHKDPNKCPHSLLPKDSNKRPKPTHTLGKLKEDEQNTADPVPEEDELAHEEQLDELYVEYESTKPQVLKDVTTDLIPHQLASTLETWMWKHYTSDEINQVHEKAD